MTPEGCLIRHISDSVLRSPAHFTRTSTMGSRACSIAAPIPRMSIDITGLFSINPRPRFGAKATPQEVFVRKSWPLAPTGRRRAEDSVPHY